MAAWCGLLSQTCERLCVRAGACKGIPEHLPGKQRSSLHESQNGTCVSMLCTAGYTSKRRHSPTPQFKRTLTDAHWSSVKCESSCDHKDMNTATCVSKANCSCKQSHTGLVPERRTLHSTRTPAFYWRGTQSCTLQGFVRWQAALLVCFYTAGPVCTSTGGCGPLWSASD